VHAPRRATAGLILVVFTVPVAACGSSARGTSTTKADFIARADAICSSYNDLVSNATKNRKRTAPSQAATIVQHRLVPLYQRRNDALAQLTPPAADRTTIAQIISDMKAASDEIAFDPAAFVTAHGATPLARKAAAEAAAYGFAVCGQV
jgi:hypothetical protein